MEPDAKDEKMWASRDSLETWGSLTSVVAIDCVMPPFGSITLIPMLTLLMLSTLPSCKETVCCCPGVNYIYKMNFLRYNI